MKTAVCISGQMGAFQRTYGHHCETFLNHNDCDVFVYTSDAVSQKDNLNPNFPPSSEVKEYLPGGVGWRKMYKTYGIIYNVNKYFLTDAVYNVYGDRVKKLSIEQECINEDNENLGCTKWEWMKRRQLKKMYNCNKMMHDYEKENNLKYDAVIRIRPDFVFAKKIIVEQIINGEEEVYMFGGWPCPPENRFMHQFLFDGFALAKPNVMDTFCNLYLKENPYPPLPEFKQYRKDWGDNVEYQLRTHLEENKIKVKHIITKRQDYQVVR